jgi:phosphoribosylanthranilate isomerase
MHVKGFFPQRRKGAEQKIKRRSRRLCAFAGEIRQLRKMKPTTKPRVKICCIASVAEAWLAIEAGASAIGLVSEMPSGPGPISESLIAEIAATIPPGISSFLLTCMQDTAAIIEQQRRVRVNTIQICDRLPDGSHQELREALSGVSMVQVVHVTGPESVEEAIAVAPHVNAVLLDSGDQSLAIKELGGTGRTHDWSLSRKIREAIDAPLFLAGGLNPQNVATAIKEVQPFGIDVCSGLRTGGHLDPQKLTAFLDRIT